MNIITLKTAQFVALLLTGLSAGVAFTHLLELPNKMSLSAQNYLLVQQHLYQGFGRVIGPIEVGAFLAAIAIVVLVRRRRVTFLLTLFAVICLAIALVVWEIYNGSVNQTVDSWTIETMPSNWVTYRNRWEYAHAARAILYTFGFSALTLSMLVDTQTSRFCGRTVQHGADRSEPKTAKDS